MITLQDCLAALEGVSASLKESNPQLSATVGWAKRGIEQEVGRLTLQLENTGYPICQQMQGGNWVPLIIAPIYNGPAYSRNATRIKNLPLGAQDKEHEVAIHPIDAAPKIITCRPDPDQE